MAESKFVFDVVEADFPSVVARSHEVPIVLDFWAGWCQPCRILTPVLLALAEEYAGKFLLGKVNVDDCPYLANQFQVSGIPMVVALVDGEVVSHFTGVVDEAQARRFFDSILPSSVEQSIRQAAEWEVSDPEKAKSIYESVLEEDPRNSLALAALAELCLNAGDAARAATLVEEVSEGTEGWSRAQNVRSRLEFLAQGKEVGTIADCQAKVSASPDDLNARLALGIAHAAAGQFAEALEALVHVVEKDRSFGNEHAKGLMVKIFGILGPHAELSNTYRSRLASALY